MGAKKIRPPRHTLKFVVVKRWVTGERAELDEDEIKRELEAKMLALMVLSRQTKFYGHKILPINIGSWRFGRTHTDRRDIIYDVYRCPMRHWCKCHVACRVVTAPEYIERQ